MLSVVSNQPNCRMSQRPVIALAGAPVIENRRRLEQAGLDVEVRDVPDGLSAADYRAAVADATVIVGTELPHDVSDLAGLKLFQVHAAGYDKVPFARLPATATICRSGGHGPAIAEYVLMALLAASHRLPQVDRHLRAGNWADRGMYLRPLRREFSDSVVGILGHGEIGRAVARLCAPLCREVIAVTRRPQQDDCVARWFGEGELHRFLGECDHLVVALPLNDATQGLLGAAEFAAMKPTAILVNVARGAVLDEQALYDALAAGRLGGAALDVWWHYPRNAQEVVRPSTAPFETLDNVIMTPHQSGWSEQTLVRRWEVIVHNVRVALEGGGAWRDLVRG